MKIHLSPRVRELCSNVTNLVGWIYIVEIQEQKHTAHMLQACGLGSSHSTVYSQPMSAGQVMSSRERGPRGHAVSSGYVCCSPYVIRSHLLVSRLTWPI